MEEIENKHIFHCVFIMTSCTNESNDTNLPINNTYSIIHRSAMSRKSTFSLTSLNQLNFTNIKTFIIQINKSSASYIMIIRDYLMAFWISPEVSTRDPIISPRTDNGRGLIMRVITKTL